MNKSTSNFVAKFCAFTLAETLIVMGIIGIVSALTLPNLNSSTGEKEKVAKVKKLYQNLTDAFGRSQVVYGPFADVVEQKNLSSDNATKFGEVLGERLIEFMKISKNCKSNYKGCFSDFTLDSGYTSSALSSFSYSFVLADGTSVFISAAYLVGGLILIDIDGPNKGNSTLDKDIFAFALSYDDDYSEIKPLGKIEQCISNKKYCASWVIQNDNMDYLKVDSQGKCPNGKVLDTTTNTTCK